MFYRGMFLFTHLSESTHMSIVEELTTAGRRGREEGRRDYLWSWEQQGEYMGRRQLFLRSYRFSRQQPPRERVRGALLRARRLVWARLLDACRLPRLLWAKLRQTLSGCRAALLDRRARIAHRRLWLSPRPAATASVIGFQRILHRRSASHSSSGSGSSASAAEWPTW